MNALRWEDAAPDGSKTLTDGERTIGRILPFDDGRFAVGDELVETETGVYRWTRTFAFVVGDVPETECRLTMEFRTAFEPTYWMIPAVSYNGNPWGKGEEPKGLTRGGEPWTFAYHRTAVAGATYSEGERWSAALFGETPRVGGVGFSCALAPSPGGLVHRLIWPEEEGPLVYDRRDEYAAPYRSRLELRPGDRFTAVAYVVIAPVTEPHAAWRKLLDAAWRQRAELVRARHDADTLWRLGIAYAKRCLWTTDGGFQGFAIGLRWDEARGEWSRRRHYEIGWCGQNASLANSLLADFLRTGDDDSRNRALALLDGWTSAGRLPNGLIRCHYDFLLFRPDRPEVQDACNLGTAAMNLFEAERLAARCGAERPVYRATALGICDFALRAQAPDGRIGKSWTNDGAVVDPDGTVGCFLVPPLVTAYEVTGDEAYLRGAEAGYRYYVRGLLEDGYTTAGALDTYCIDKESAIPLLKAGLLLHRATGEKQYLAWAEKAAWYLATWQWHYRVPYDRNTALGAMRYDTFGGTAVSTQHHHMDPYALAFVADWLALSKATGDPRWRVRAKAAWANASIGISDGSLVVMGKRRPEGSQDEGFCHTRWLDPFQTTQWLVAWPTAFRLETLRHLAGDPFAAELWESE